MAATEMGVWGLQDVRDKQLAGEWSYESNVYQLWLTGENEAGQIGDNTIIDRSSPVQLPGIYLKAFRGDSKTALANKIDNTLWFWGRNTYGQAAQNTQTPGYSSPVQIPGTWTRVKGGAMSCGIKADGTLWTWGFNNGGALGQNNVIDAPTGNVDNRSSPVQIPGTYTKLTSSSYSSFATKRDGALWVWGYGNQGQLAQGNLTQYSSPVQIPGTTWDEVAAGGQMTMAVKTDGSLWVWGNNSYGQLGLNEATGNYKNSPNQVGSGVDWGKERGKFNSSTHNGAIKTDGTLWMWGRNDRGQLASNNATKYSSPTQVPGTTWEYIQCNSNAVYASKTDGTMWAWGDNQAGLLGQGDVIYRSSPVQLPGNYTIKSVEGSGATNGMLLKQL